MYSVLVWAIVACHVVVWSQEGADALAFLQPAPTFLEGILGLNLKINCSTNDPNATVSLFHSATPFGLMNERLPSANKIVKSGQVFTILSLTINDGGHHKCKAQNKHQSIEWPPGLEGITFLARAELPDHFVLKPDTPIIIMTGQDGKVTCETEGISIAKLQWNKVTGPPNAQVDTPVPDNMVTLVNDTSTNILSATLRITNAQKQDAGIYKCVVTVFHNSKVRSARVEVRGADDLAFLQNPVPTILQGFLGLNLKINCSTNDPNATVSLFHQTTRFSPPKERLPLANKIVKSGQVFTILDFTINDSGNHKCKAHNKHQSIEWPPGTGMTFWAIAEVPDHFVLKPDTPIVLMTGQDGKVTCETEGASIAKVQWNKVTGPSNAQVDTPVPDSMVTVVKDASTNILSATLKITHAQRQDAGIYKCVVTVFHKSEDKSARVEVKGADDLAFLQQPAPTFLMGILGLNLKVNCSTNDPNATVSLFHQANPFSPLNERLPSANKIVKSGQVFAILSLTINDGGNHKCKAQNKHQSIEWPPGTGMTFLTRAELPDHFVLKPDTPIVLRTGQDGKVTCETEGASIAKLQWNKVTGPSNAQVDTPVPDSMVTVVKDTSTNILSAILSITNARKQDAGIYKCVVTVLHGSENRSASLRVEVKEECKSALGMRSKIIPDENITASSSLSAKHSPAFGRLGGQGAWCSAQEDSPYIQISFDEEKLITKLKTQGSNMDLLFAMRYDVKYLEGKNWISYNKTLMGKRNYGSVQKNRLKPPIRTSSIRIYPKEPVSMSPFPNAVLVPCLRLELYGCTAPDFPRKH